MLELELASTDADDAIMLLETAARQGGAGAQSRVKRLPAPVFEQNIA